RAGLLGPDDHGLRRQWGLAPPTPRGAPRRLTPSPVARVGFRQPGALLPRPPQARATGGPPKMDQQTDSQPMNASYRSVESGCRRPSFTDQSPVARWLGRTGSAPSLPTRAPMRSDLKRTPL